MTSSMVSTPPRPKKPAAPQEAQEQGEDQVELDLHHDGPEVREVREGHLAEIAEEGGQRQEGERVHLAAEGVGGDEDRHEVERVDAQQPVGEEGAVLHLPPRADAGQDEAAQHHEEADAAIALPEDEQQGVARLGQRAVREVVHQHDEGGVEPQVVQPRHVGDVGGLHAAILGRGGPGSTRGRAAR